MFHRLSVSAASCKHYLSMSAQSKVTGFPPEKSTGTMNGFVLLSTDAFSVPLKRAVVSWLCSRLHSSCEVNMLFSLCRAYLGQRTAWSQEELTFLRDHFASLKRPPNFAEVHSAVRRMPAIRKRSLPQIKTRVWALLRMWTVSTCSLYLEAILAVFCAVWVTVTCICFLYSVRPATATWRELRPVA